jgi:hypothetical protein
MTVVSGIGLARRPAIHRLRSEPRIALDRATARRVDHDGHLHVAGNVLSASVVSPYYGAEIPDYQALGLQADKIYQLLRDPRELAKATGSFAGKPLLVQHQAINASDHAHELVAGAVSNPTFDAATGQLKGDLVIWDGDAIRAIQNGTNAALSCGYFYRAQMEAGTYQGVRYDGRMVDIKANHVSLVPEGRVAMAMVGDAAISNRRLRMATDENGSDDTRDKLLQFLAGKMNGEDLLQAIKIIDGVDNVDEAADPEMAGDRRRQAADAKRKQLSADEARRLKMFPNSNRLARS